MVSYGGVVAISQGRLSEQERAKAEAAQSAPELQGLVQYVRQCWQRARDHKRLHIEPKMFKALRQRQGEYDPDKLADIRKQGGSEVYMTLTGNKCRAASSWIKDAVMGQQGDRPWGINASPMPDLPDNVAVQVKAQVSSVVQQAMANGYKPQPGEAYALEQAVRDQTLNALREDAQSRADRMADKMEDQLVEGGWLEALANFIDDLVTFHVACLKGPVVRRRKKLTWESGANGIYTPVVEDKLVPEFERVSPFDIYPSPDASTPEDGYFIERHKLLRSELLSLKGVEGYNDEAIDLVLERYYAHGWAEWLFGDMERADIEGRAPTSLYTNPDGRIDAVQFWGSINGRMLLDWGMDSKDIPDAGDDYEVELWLVNEVVIKCVLNPDPLKRRPYYTTSYSKNPGGFYGDSVPSIIEDIQAVCNATARALVNNMGLASGPQVAITVDRLAPGEDVTQIFPWKIHQFTSDPTGSQQPPISFFQPNPMVAELMGCYEKFETKADDYTGIPRYMVGGETSGGIGRTSSGLSMMIQNAGKAIKQVLMNIDVDIFFKVLHRLYDWNMRYADDPDLKGDVNIVVRGANSAVAKDAIHLRRNEFLQATANPIDMQIVGAEGRATLLREIAKDLDVNVDRVVPDAEAVKLKAAAINQQMANQAPTQGSQAPQGGPSQGPATPTPSPMMAPMQPPLRQPGAQNPGALMVPMAQK
jgi:hypothetical protein